LALVGKALLDCSLPAEEECCPHCGGLLRVQGISPKLLATVSDWLEEKASADRE
jgi:hypothetical protein